MINQQQKVVYTVYMHVNKTNQKKYIGYTSKSLNIRWGKNGNRYYKESQTYFFNAIKKYGWDNFEHIILAEVETLNEARALEKQYIKTYHTCIYDPECWGYNMTFGGEGTFKYPTIEAALEAERKVIDKSNTKWRLANLQHVYQKQKEYYLAHQEQLKKYSLERAQKIKALRDTLRVLYKEQPERFSQEDIHLAFGWKNQKSYVCESYKKLLTIYNKVTAVSYKQQDEGDSKNEN